MIRLKTNAEIMEKKMPLTAEAAAVQVQVFYRISNAEITIFLIIFAEKVIIFFSKSINEYLL